MTDIKLKALISKLNKNKTDGLIHLRPLTELVDFAKVWTEKPRPTDTITFPDGPYDFYFIKDQEKKYVGTVVDMTSDLHWFILSGHRGKGHLTRALKEAILPDLIKGRKEQRITINRNQIGARNFKSSEKVALSTGFIKNNETEYILKSKDFITKHKIKGGNTDISEERIGVLKKQINYLSRSLWVIQTEIEMKFGNDKYVKELGRLVDELKKHTWKLEDTWWDSKKNKIK